MDARPDPAASAGRPTFVGRHRTAIDYGVAVGTSVVAFAISRSLHRPLLKLSPFILFYAAVAVSSWFGGFGPGLLAVVIGTAVTDYYLFEPRSSLLLHEPLDTVTLLIFLFVGVLISGLKSRLREARRQADDHQGRLATLSAELLAIEERERRRIATVLHDAIGQNLLVAKLQLGALVTGGGLSDGQVDRAANIGGLLDAAIGRTRTLTSEVSPPVLYELGLEAAVRWLAAQARQQHGLRVVVRDDGQPKPLGGTVRLVLFDGVRELLANAAKHAGGADCQVSIGRDGGTVRVDVRDGGGGFSAADVDRNGGFGLFNLRERLRRVGGRMEISTLPDAGAHVTIAGPVETDTASLRKATNDPGPSHKGSPRRRPPDDSSGPADHAGRGGGL